MRKLPLCVIRPLVPSLVYCNLTGMLGLATTDPAWEALHAILGWRECRQLDRGSYDVMASVGR